MKVIVIDDSAEIAEVVSLCFRLRWPGATVVPAADGKGGLETIESENPDIVILDVGLPDMNGFEVLREIRRFSRVPVIMLTVRSEDTDVARGLELGADDYVTKPFSHIELIARVQAVLRRTQGGAAVTSEERPYVNGKIWVDFGSGEIRVDDKPVKLTSTEFKLLTHLVRNEGRVLSHENLLTKVWGGGLPGHERPPEGAHPAPEAEAGRYPGLAAHYRHRARHGVQVRAAAGGVADRRRTRRDWRQTDRVICLALESGKLDTASSLNEARS